MKLIYALLLALTISTNINGMKRARKEAAIKSSTQTLTLTMLPDDCLSHICLHIHISHEDNNWLEWKKSSRHVQAIANTIKALTLTNQRLNTLYSPTRIASLLHFNDSNKNLFLLRSAQAGIPCLVRYAIAHDADVNYDKKNEFQPLTGAVTKKNHTCVRLLLEANASTEQSTKNFPVYRQPIQLATQLSDLPMVKLLLDFGANPNTIGLLDYNRALRMTKLQNTLNIALHLHNAPIAQLLVERGAIVHKKDKRKLEKLLATLKPKQKKKKVLY